jgi:hypothetical protein
MANSQQDASTLEASEAIWTHAIELVSLPYMNSDNG